MYDSVEVDIPDDLLLKLTIQAHDLDITLNQHVCNLLDKGLERSDTMFQAIEEIGRNNKDGKRRRNLKDNI